MHDGPAQSDLRDEAQRTAERTREEARHLRERWDEADATMGAVAAAITLAAAGMTLMAAFWLVRSRRRSRDPFPSPAVHRR